MKIYFYDEDTGIFQGETFEGEKAVNFLAGATSVPPPAYGKGDIPVYDFSTKCWVVMSLADARRRLD